MLSTRIATNVRELFANSELSYPSLFVFSNVNTYLNNHIP